MENHQLINADSGKQDWQTQSFIIEAARKAMGGIDLDPASSAQANLRIGAKAFFTKEDDGLSKKYFGKVWQNHPFSREGNKLWIDKLVSEYEKVHIQQACCITFASTSEEWFQPLAKRPQCYLVPRTNYLRPDGTLARGVSKGSVVTFFGTDVDSFAHAFKDLGVVKIPYIYK